MGVFIDDSLEFIFYSTFWQSDLEKPEKTLSSESQFLVIRNLAGVHINGKCCDWALRGYAAVFRIACFESKIISVGFF